MDYVFFSSIVGITLLITISYDIVCQWKINLNARIQKMPAVLRPDAPNVAPFSERVSAGIPVWHAAAHEDKCKVAHSLRFLPGVGHTDGEGIERGWSHMNQHASSMKEMGQGNRHDSFDDIIGSHNWERNLAQGTFSIINVYYAVKAKSLFSGDTLSRRVIIAKEERDNQIAAFDEVRRTVDNEQAQSWIDEVTEWEEKRNTDHKWPNPYELPRQGAYKFSSHLDI